MTYKKEIYEAARETLRQRKSKAEEKAAHTLRDFLANNPEAKQIRSQIQTTGSRAAVAVVRGGDVRKELTQLKEINLRLQEEFRQILSGTNLRETDITPQYTCKKCADSGYVDGFLCSCLKDELKKICYEELNRITPLEISGFDTFSLEYFKSYPQDQRKIMESIFSYCKKYAEDFSLTSPNLLFQGRTGLGKTHLSLAIAKSAIEKGYGVIYGSVHNFAVSIEKERFDSMEDTDTSSLLSSCDLLLLDDLGTEFTSSYTVSVIYNIINARIMRKLPTIISTNLTTEELQKRYSERLISRLFGSYNRLGFVGRDIRAVKKFHPDS
ncbi:MAG: ATP-binding protein [Oscillospiraceae bacterium]